MTSRPGARDLIRVVLDAGTFESWDSPLAQPTTPDSTYAAELSAAAERAGTDEAVITGSGLLRGRRVAVLVSEFRFLGGSIGVAASNRLEDGIRRATAEGLPLLAATASGGTRMQEGAAAFVQMARITDAIGAHKAAGLPYLVYLRHPTTGGVFASWGSLGHVTVGEPGALIGFLGPKVYKALYGEDFPEGVQTAENLAAHGLIDAVLPAERLAEIAARALGVLAAGEEPAGPPPLLDVDSEPPAPAWESISLTRRPDRPGVRELLRYGATGIVPMHGTGQGESHPGLLMMLCQFQGYPCVLLGQDRSSSTLLDPAALRVARRGMRIAAELHLPLVSVIDTPGATLSKDAEEGGLAGEIARCLADLMALPTQTLCVLLGQGSGGAALALLPADRVIAARHAWLSPLPPEGASAIMHHGDPSYAAEMAAAQGVRASDLHRRGVVDTLIAERPDAASEPAAFSRRMGSAIGAQLAELKRTAPTGSGARVARYRLGA
jgi:acyl-CoA carboxylase subunit beta